MGEDDVIRFQAQVFKLQTLIDGGLRLTLDLSLLEDKTILALLAAKQPGVILEIAAVAIDEDAPLKRFRNGDTK